LRHLLVRIILLASLKRDENIIKTFFRIKTKGWNAVREKQNENKRKETKTD
jgi:hypothetical protein